jgi:hypothetical protein
MALVEERRGNLDAAVQILNSLPGLASHRRASLLLASLLNDRSGAGDRDAALAVLRPWIDALGTLPRDAAIEVLQMAVQVHLDAVNPAEARHLLDGVRTDALDPGMWQIMNGNVLLASGDAEGAKAALASGADEVLTEGDWADRRVAALLAERLGVHPTAFRLWRSFVEPTYFGGDTYKLLRAAQASDDDGFILNFCRSLREHGAEDRRAYEFEINALLRCREPEAAKTLMLQWLQSHADDLEMRLHLSLLAAERGEDELVETDPAKLPAVASVRNAQLGAAVSHVLRQGPRPILAAEYAYHLWRRFPDEMAAQMAIIAAVLSPLGNRIQFDRPTTVDANSSVRYRETAGADARPLLAVVEGGSSPSLVRSEYPPDHPLIRAMWGKGASDRFHYGGREYVITAVENKIIHRAQECMEGFDHVFPDNPAIRRFSVSPNIEKETDFRKALGEVWQFLEADDKRRRQVEGLYKERGIPIPMLARKLSHSVIETMGYLAGNRDLAIRCCSSENSDWERAISGLRSAKEVVLDSTAIATLHMLGLHHRLRGLPFRCLIPDSAIQDLRKVASRFDRAGEQRGYLGVEDGRPVFREASPEQETAWVRNLEELVTTLRTDCEIVGGSAILELKAEHREGLVSALGPGVADAIAVATQRGAVLWTDDFMTGAVATNEWKVQRAWTQAALTSLRGEAGTRDLRDAIGKLFAWGYDFTRLSVGAAIDLLCSAGWSESRDPGASVIAYVCALAGDNAGNCRITSALIASLWMRCPKEKVARVLIECILEGIGRPVSGPYIARPLYRLPFNRLPQSMHAKFRRLKRFLRNWRGRSLS